MLSIRVLSAILLIAAFSRPEKAIGGQSAKPGRLAPAFTLRDLSGNEFKSSQLKGNVVVLDLWATWCEPCVADIPMFNRIYEKYRDRGVKIVGITVESGGITDVKPHIVKHGIKYTALVGNTKIMDQYQVTGFPITYLIGPDGKIVKKYTGTPSDKAGEKETDLEREIQRLLQPR
ncbi:MAG: TlpA family protein disulfide reductase [Acidobacteria bacterium]|nr:TlpA family protein disulfide reductase [Acidobacteriota bacterium]